jgi:hypothetical protein
VSNKFDYSFTCARFTTEAFYYEYRGKTVITLLPESGPKETITDFTVLHRTTYGLHAYYFFNNRRYTQAAAYCYSKYQRRSAGSLIAGIRLLHRDMSLNVQELPDFAREQFAEDDELPRFLYNDYCVMVGYGYNWVIGRRWLLHFSMLPTYVVYNRNSLTVRGERKRAQRMRLNMIFNERAAVVYNFSPRYFAGATLVMNNSVFDDDMVLINQNKWRARAFVGMRL